MAAGILGRKVGMTRVFDDNGRAVAATVVQAGPCVVVQRKTVETDGYEAVQVGFEGIAERKLGRVKRPVLGHFATKNVSPMKHLREFRVSGDDEYASGDEITVEIFEVGQRVSVTGITKGKGFAGVIKRHGFHGGPASHGSKVHRAPMSAGATDAARTFPGQRMPGQMGNVRRKVLNLTVVDVDAESNMLVVKGSIPGPNGGLVAIESN